MLNCVGFRIVAAALAIVGLFSSCVSVNIPKEYVPDNQVVFLMQQTDYGPIKYDIVPADPYVFTPDQTAVDAVNPKFLKDLRFDSLLKADFPADTRLYREVAAHFQYVLKLLLFAELRPLLDSADIKPPAPIVPNKGDKIQDYSNATEFQYPDAADASIVIFTAGGFVIHFADKSLYQQDVSGLYFWKDAAGKETQFYDPAKGNIRVIVGDTMYEKGVTSRSMTNSKGRLEYTSDPTPQYNLVGATEKAPRYTYFIDAGGAVKSCAVQSATGIRFDYFPDDQIVLAQQGAQAVSIGADFQKVHGAFDIAKRQTTNILSLYLPQGIRLTNLDANSPSYGELSPAWPEGYKMKVMGPFNVWYTPKDEPLLTKINANRLNEIEAKGRSLSGLSGTSRRSIVIPPDLESYRRLQAFKPGDKLNWYPSGFETLDYITMWPISVPRYKQAVGQDYFFNVEFNEIVAHEYIHILVGENSGLLSPVPVWLNEGLAVYVEGQLFPDARKYWDITFQVSRDLKRLLPWTQVTLHSTGELPVAQARIHYAQSWAMVSRLIEKFGAAKVAQYVRSFRVKSTDATKVDLSKVYQENFLKVFGITWDKGVELLYPTKTKTS